MRKLEMLMKDEPVQPKIDKYVIVSDKIINAVNKEFQVICTVSMRTKRISDARAVAMYLLCKYTTATLTEVALMLGRTDHTTVMVAKKKVRDYMSIYDDFKEKVERIEQSIK